MRAHGVDGVEHVAIVVFSQSELKGDDAREVIVVGGVDDLGVVLVGGEDHDGFFGLGDLGETFDHELDHTALGNACVIAFGTGAEVGCDVEVLHGQSFEGQLFHLVDILGVGVALNESVAATMGTDFEAEHGRAKRPRSSSGSKVPFLMTHSTAESQASPIVSPMTA